MQLTNKNKNNNNNKNKNMISRRSVSKFPALVAGRKKLRGAPKLPTSVEFLTNFREHIATGIQNAYRTEHQTFESPSAGTITTTLCEDVFSLVNVQVELLHEYLVSSKILNTTSGADLLLDGILCIILNLASQQLQNRSRFMTDLESSCAAANDFYRMMENTEELVSRLERKYPKIILRYDAEETPDSPGGVVIVENQRAMEFHREASNLLTMFSNDAVYAVQHAHIYVLREIQASDIPRDLFSRDWEDKFTANEIALSIVRTVEDFLYDVHNWLCNDFLYRKIVTVLVQAVVCFYVRCLVHKAERVRCKRGRGRKAVPTFGPAAEQPFRSPSRAHVRMSYDVQILQNYFQQLVGQMPALAKVVQAELEIIEIIQECFGLAAGETFSTPKELLVVLHKRTGGVQHITRFLVMDIWLLGAPQKSPAEIDDMLSVAESDMQLVSRKVEDKDENPSSSTVFNGLTVEDMLQEFYDDRRMQEKNSVCGTLVSSLNRTTERVKLIRCAKPFRHDVDPDYHDRRTASSIAEALSSDDPGDPRKQKCQATSSGYFGTDHVDAMDAFQEKMFGVLKLHNLHAVNPTMPFSHRSKKPRSEPEPAWEASSAPPSKSARKKTKMPPPTESPEDEVPHEQKPFMQFSLRVSEVLKFRILENAAQETHFAYSPLGKRSDTSTTRAEI